MKNIGKENPNKNPNFPKSKKEDKTLENKDSENMKPQEVKPDNTKKPKPNLETASFSKKKDINTNKEIERMFNEAVHEAFDSSKNEKEHEQTRQQIRQKDQQLQQHQSEQRKDHQLEQQDHHDQQHNQQEEKSTERVQNSFPSPNIHTDSGLILSENEIDTIDDAPDTSQQENANTIDVQSNETAKSLSVETSNDKNPTKSETTKSTFIDGNSDSMKKDKNRYLNEFDDHDLEKVAGEILKMNDSNAVLKALTSVKHVDDIDTYPDTLTNHKSSNPGTKNKTQSMNSQKESDGSKLTDENDVTNSQGNVENNTAQSNSINDTANPTNEITENFLGSHNDTSDHKGTNNVLNDKASSTGKALSTTDEDTPNQGYDRTTNEEDSTNDPNDSNIQLHTVDNEENKQPEENSQVGYAADQTEDENSGEGEDGPKNNTNTYFDDLFGSGSGEVENKNSTKNGVKTNHLGDIDWGNLHALNALVEILAEHEKNQSYKANYSGHSNRSNNGNVLAGNSFDNARNLSNDNNTSERYGINKVSTETNHDKQVNSSKLPDINNDGDSKFRETTSNSTKTELKPGNGELLAGYVHGNHIDNSKLPGTTKHDSSKHEVKTGRGSNNTKLLSKNNATNSNNTKEEENDNSGEVDLSVKQLFNTGLKMLKNYAVEEKRFNVSGTFENRKHNYTKPSIPSIEPSVTEVTDDAPIKATSKPSERPIADRLATKNTSNGFQKMDTESSLTRNSSQSKLHHKPATSLFEVLKEVVSTFTKLSSAINTTESNNTNDVTKTESNNTNNDNSGSIQQNVHTTPIESKQEPAKITTQENDLVDNGKNLGPWTAWTECSQSCGLGFKSRMRQCMSEKKPCEGLLKQNQSCHLANCLGKEKLCLSSISIDQIG